jgi:hypothetical protein
MGASILMTSAPKSPNVFAAKGPAMSWPISITLRFAKGSMVVLFSKNDIYDYRPTPGEPLY